MAVKMERRGRLKLGGGINSTWYLIMYGKMGEKEGFGIWQVGGSWFHLLRNQGRTGVSRWCGNDFRSRIARGNRSRVGGLDGCSRLDEILANNFL